MSDTISCPSCDATYKRGGLAAGKKVKCPKCEAVITVPAGEPAPERVRTPSRASAAGARGARSARGARGARASRERSQPARKSSLSPLLGVGIVVAVGVVVFFVTRGGGEAPGKQDPVAGAKSASEDLGSGQSKSPGEQPKPPAEKPKPPAEKPKTAREIFDAHLADADKVAAAGEKAGHFLEAIAILEANGWADAGVSVDDLYRKIIEVDPDHARARRALGFLQYTGGYEKYKDQWLTKDRYAEVQKEWQELTAKREKEAAAEAERERWTKNGFARKCAKVRDWIDSQAEKVSSFKLRYFFDTEDIPVPYLFAVEDVNIPDPAQTAKLMGRNLAELRDVFRRAHKEETLVGWKRERFVVPVLVFQSAKSFESYRKASGGIFPSSTGVGAFYWRPPAAFTEPMGFKGMLYVWQFGQDSRFDHNLFHEGVHQLADNSCTGNFGSSYNWIQEGLAEFFAAHTRGLSDGKLQFGRLTDSIIDNRWHFISANAKAYFQSEQKPSLERFLTFTPAEFQDARSKLKEGSDASPAEKQEAAVIQTSAYAIGWAFIFYSHYAEGGKFRAAWHKVLQEDLMAAYSLDMLKESYGLEDEEAWKEFERKFFLWYLRGDGRKYKNGAKEVPPLPLVR